MKQLISNYSFDASEGTVVFSDFASISLNRVLLITNLADKIRAAHLGITAGEKKSRSDY